MALRMLSSAVAKRFPSYQHLVQVATFNIKHLVQGVGGLIQSELFFIELAKNKICQGERERERARERESQREFLARSGFANLLGSQSPQLSS